MRPPFPPPKSDVPPRPGRMEQGVPPWRANQATAKARKEATSSAKQMERNAASTNRNDFAKNQPEDTCAVEEEVLHKEGEEEEVEIEEDHEDDGDGDELWQ